MSSQKRRGYDNPPWHFQGKALYQLSLVKVEEAKKYVPPELPLVNLFGYTLGGFYLARYTDSPVGPFDEMVAMAGLAWNFPTSCAWAARVYVNNREARDHGIQEVGLPSRLAAFKALPLPSLAAQPSPAALPASGNSSSADGGGSTATPGGARLQWAALSAQSARGPAGSIVDRTVAKMQATGASWWDGRPLRRGRSGSVQFGRGGGSGSSSREATLVKEEPSGAWAVELHNQESASRGRQGPARGLAGGPVCRIELPPQEQGRGPRIEMRLPSFSGATPDYPGLLQYDLLLKANIRPVPTARLTFPLRTPSPASTCGSGSSSSSSQQQQQGQQNPEVLGLVLSGRPLLCLEFADMDMQVQPPVPWHPRKL